MKRLPAGRDGSYARCGCAIRLWRALGVAALAGLVVLIALVAITLRLWWGP